MGANRACQYCGEEVFPDQVCDDGMHHAADCCTEAASAAEADRRKRDLKYEPRDHDPYDD